MMESIAMFLLKFITGIVLITAVIGITWVCTVIILFVIHWFWDLVRS